VAMRGPSVFENFCSCADFAVNTLGTCKHIEALLLRLRRRFGRSFDSHRYQRTRASLSLHYGDTVNVRLRLPSEPSADLRKIVSEYFDSNAFLERTIFGDSSKLSRSCGPWTRRPLFYSDVLDFVDRENELTSGLEDERRYLAQLKKGKRPLEGLLKVPLFPTKFAERSSLPVGAGNPRRRYGSWQDNPGIAGAELLRRRRGIERVLVVAPASVKYQWKTEIEKFCNLPAQVIDGLMPHRKKLYASPTFFNLTSYELVLKDIEDMHNIRPDLIILDEAQRIRNWATATARIIKQMKSRYALY